MRQFELWGYDYLSHAKSSSSLLDVFSVSIGRAYAFEACKVQDFLALTADKHT